MTFWKKKKKGEEQESQESTSEAVPAPTVRPVMKDEVEETWGKPKVVQRAIDAQPKPGWWKRNLAPSKEEVKTAIKKHEEEGTPIPSNVKRVVVAGRLQGTVAESGKAMPEGVREARAIARKKSNAPKGWQGKYQDPFHSSYGGGRSMRTNFGSPYYSMSGPMARDRGGLMRSQYPSGPSAHMRSLDRGGEDDIFGAGKEIESTYRSSSFNNNNDNPLNAGNELNEAFGSAREQPGARMQRGNGRRGGSRNTSGMRVRNPPPDPLRVFEDMEMELWSPNNRTVHAKRGYEGMLDRKTNVIVGEGNKPERVMRVKMNGNNDMNLDMDMKMDDINIMIGGKVDAFGRYGSPRSDDILRAMGFRNNNNNKKRGLPW